MLVNGSTDGSMTTSVTHQSLIVKHSSGPERALLADTLLQPSLSSSDYVCLVLHIYMHSQACFALEERKPVSLTHIPLRGHIYCSLFIGSIKENVSS